MPTTAAPTVDVVALLQSASNSAVAQACAASVTAAVAVSNEDDCWVPLMLWMLALLSAIPMFLCMIASDMEMEAFTGLGKDGVAPASGPMPTNGHGENASSLLKHAKITIVEADDSDRPARAPPRSRFGPQLALLGCASEAQRCVTGCPLPEAVPHEVDNPVLSAGSTP